QPNPVSRKAGTLQGACVKDRWRRVCAGWWPWLILSGDLGDWLACGGAAGGVPGPAGRRGFDSASADPGPTGPVQAFKHGAADVAGEVTGTGDDIAGAYDQRLGGFDGDLVAGAVGAGARDGGDGVGDREPQRLAAGQQRPHLLLQPGRVARAEHLAVQQGVAQGQVGGLVLSGKAGGVPRRPPLSTARAAFTASQREQAARAAVQLQAVRLRWRARS